MGDRAGLERALEGLRNNCRQSEAVQERGNCVVLAGPGSGKTRTLTVALARALFEDVQEPRGIACITYNNESAYELQDRLVTLGISPSRQVFIGTVHAFALSQVIVPYARCLFPEFTDSIAVATRAQTRQAVQLAFEEVGGYGDSGDRWRFAQEKRRRDVDRTAQSWRGRNPELADFIEAYERILRRQALVDFDDMPLLAYRMVNDNAWVARAIVARYPALFVDEYQDLGVALHELVVELCFGAGARLFAVGDPDQSIYAFTGAHPELLEALAKDTRVRPIRLRINYRCARNIVSASIGVLQEARDYDVPDDASDGDVTFLQVDGGLLAQAECIFDRIVPELRAVGIPLSEIAILYRGAAQGDYVASAAAQRSIEFLRADSNALVPRNNPVARFIEACAAWICGGWKLADPPFTRLSRLATDLVFPGGASAKDRLRIEQELMAFLGDARDHTESTNLWLSRFQHDVLSRWRQSVHGGTDDWDVVGEILRRTSMGSDRDLPVAEFCGRQSESGRLTLSTLHSSKGREFKAVIMFAMNSDIIPDWRDKTAQQIREARRLFYVGVTRTEDQLYFVCGQGRESLLVREFRERLSRNTT